MTNKLETYVCECGDTDCNRTFQMANDEFMAFCIGTTGAWVLSIDCNWKRRNQEEVVLHKTDVYKIVRYGEPKNDNKIYR